MKKLLFSLIATIYASIAFAGPFGIEKGMTLAQVRAVSKTTPEAYEGDLYMISPQKTHDKFDKYLVRIDPEYGVYWLKAVSKDVYTNAHGTELMDTFNSIVRGIEVSYGSYERIDKQEGYVGSELGLFMYALQQGAREVGAIWAEDYKSNIPEDISSIGVWITAHEDCDIGNIHLSYYFSNYGTVKAKADTVF